MIRKVIVSVFALGGAVGASQAPELTQQYTQRVGGAVDELGAIVRNFDADAARDSGSRDAALRELDATAGASANQGRRMRETITRYDHLTEQYDRLLAARPFERTWIVMRNPDTKILNATISDYRPGVPTTVEGAGHAAAGGGVLGLIGALFAGAFSRRRRNA